MKQRRSGLTESLFWCKGSVMTDPACLGINEGLSLLSNCENIRNIIILCDTAEDKDTKSLIQIIWWVFLSGEKMCLPKNNDMILDTKQLQLRNVLIRLFV